MTVVVLDDRIAAVPVGIEAFRIVLAASAIDFVELHDRVVSAPRPDAHVVVLRALAGMGYDVELNHRAVSGNVHNSVTANIVEYVVPDHHSQARIPLRAHPMRGRTKNTAPIHVVDMVILDAEIHKTTRLSVPDTVISDSPVLFHLVTAVDVVNIETLNVDVMRFAVIFGHDANTAPDSRRCSCVGHFEIADLPVLLILQQDGVLGLALAVNHRLRLAAVLINQDRTPPRPRSLRPELSGPGRAGLEENAITGGKEGRVDLGQSFPGHG